MLDIKNRHNTHPIYPQKSILLMLFSFFAWSTSSLFIFIPYLTKVYSFFKTVMSWFSFYKDTTDNHLSTISDKIINGDETGVRVLG